MKNILSHFNLGTISKHSRFDSLSIVSRQSVFAIILVFLTAFGGNAWGGTKRIYCEYSDVSSWWGNDGRTAIPYIYAWGGDQDAKKYTMTATGTSNLAYCDIDDYHTSLLFFRSTSQTGSWDNQTVDVTIGSNNRWSVLDSKTDSKNNISNAQRWVPGVCIDGLIDVYNPHTQAFSFDGNDGTYEVSLSEHSTYQFCILDGSTRYTLDNNVWTSNISEYTLNTSGYDLRLTTAAAGTYTFEYNKSTHVMSVTYPTVNHPSLDYCYMINYDTWTHKYLNIWNSESGIAGTTYPGTDMYNYYTKDDVKYYYFAPGDYTKCEPNDNAEGRKTDQMTPTLGKYISHDGSSWGWREFVFTITLTNNGADTYPSNPSVEFNGAVPGDLTPPTKTGYTFGGYYNTSTFNDLQIINADGEWQSSRTGYTDEDGKWIHEGGSATLYAKWTPNVYNIYYDMNGGVWKNGWVGTRTYGAGDQAISEDVTKDDYNFAGWYDDGSFTGSKYTSVPSTRASDITLYAKWEAFSKTTLTPALNPIICTASAGDLVLVTVSAVQSAYAYIQLEDKDGVAFGDSIPVSAAGTYAYSLTAAEAAKVNAGLVVSGSNYTIGSVTIKYKKDLWTGTHTSTNSWTVLDLDNSIFSGLSAGDTLGVYISAIGSCDGVGWHNYTFQADYKGLFLGNADGAVVNLHRLTATQVDSLKTKSIIVGCACLTLSGIYSYEATKTYTVNLHNNGGRVKTDSVGSYVFGTGATLPTNVTKWGYKFDGWYDNSGLTGSPVTAITTSDYGNKEYWAKWTSIAEELTVGDHPEFLAAQEGDLIVVTVTDIQPSGQIYLSKSDYTKIEARYIGNKSPGQFAFRLSASAASDIRTNGLRITGVNYTKSSVDILYRKTIWSGPVTSDNAWTTTGDVFANSLFTDLEAGNYMGVHVSATGTGCTDKDKEGKDYNVDWHNYTVQAEYRSAIVLGDATVDKDSIYLHELNADQVDSLKHKNNLLIGFACLTLSDLYTYISTRAYRVDVASVSNVTISATTPSVAEGSYGNANYGSTVTLSYSVDAGYAWGGWNVYKTGDPSTTVTVTNNQFTMPPYPVTVSAVLYTNLAAWCVPNTVTFSGDDHLTSTKDVFVQTTGKAGNLFNISCADLGSATSMEIAYLDADDDDAEVAKGDSKFRFYGGTASDSADVKDASAIDISASRELDTNYGLRYTPDAYNVTNHYKVQLTFKKGDLELKTVTKDVYGRGLPETFVIAVKNTSDSKWYALPDTLASSSGKHLQPIAIVVDNTTTPTTALYAPSVTAYQSMGRNIPANNMHGVRLSPDGTAHVRVSTSTSGENNSTLWSQTGNRDDLEAFYLKSSDFNSYQISLDAITTKKLGLYTHSTKTYMGYSANASPYAIYLLPIASFGLTISYNTSDTRVIEFHVANGNEQIWESDVINDLTATQIVGTFVVGTKNAAGEYVECTRSKEENAATINGRKITGTADMSAGATGRFQIFVNTSTNNFGLRWVPLVNETLTGGYWGGKYATEGTKWSLGRQPTIDEDVIIKHQTRIVQQDNAQAKSIKIDKSAEVNPIWDLAIDDWKGALLVKEDIKAKHYGEDEYGPTTKNDLSIRTSILGNGGLICGNKSSNTAAYYEFYSKVYRFGSYYINQYVGIPFVSMDPYQWYGVNVFEYDPTRDDWKTPENADLKPFTCYDIISKTSGISYTEFYTNGTLNLPGLDSITTLECGSRYSPYEIFDDRTGENTNGDYMFANSWTAPISVGAMDGDDVDGLLEEVHIFNAGFVSEDDSVKIIGDLAGQWTAISFAAAPYLADSLTVIPATQAFCMTATKDNAKLKLNYKKHVYDPAVSAGQIVTTATRAPRRSNAYGDPNVLQIKVYRDSVMADHLYVFEREDFTNGYDNGWDGTKIMGESFAPQLYGIQGTGKTSINAIPDMEGAEIGFKAGTQANEYTFSFEYDEQEEPLYLYDRDTQEFTEISNESTYTFVTSDRKEHARFVLTRSNVPQSPTGVEEVENETVQRAEKFMKDQQIFIRRGERVYSIDGSLVK